MWLYTSDSHTANINTEEALIPSGNSIPAVGSASSATAVQLTPEWNWKANWRSEGTGKIFICNGDRQGTAEGKGTNSFATGETHANAFRFECTQMERRQAHGWIHTSVGLIPRFHVLLYPFTPCNNFPHSSTLGYYPPPTPCLPSKTLWWMPFKMESADQSDWSQVIT